MPLPLAQEDDNCFTWNKICNAECCRQYSITSNKISPLKPGDVIEVRKPLTADQQLYYKLHGAQYQHGTLKIRVQRFMQEGSLLRIYGDCKGLTSDGRCKYHGTKQQPLICRYPNTKLGVDQQPNNITVTPNCLCNART